jgi:uncharacterized membrane protein YccC
MTLFVGVILALLAAGLALLLARETKLRRALQSLCRRLIARLTDATSSHAGRTQSRRHFPSRPHRR